MSMDWYAAHLYGAEVDLDYMTNFPMVSPRKQKTLRLSLDQMTWYISVIR